MAAAPQPPPIIHELFPAQHPPAHPSPPPTHPFPSTPRRLRRLLPHFTLTSRTLTPPPSLFPCHLQSALKATSGRARDPNIDVDLSVAFGAHSILSRLETVPQSAFLDGKLAVRAPDDECSPASTGLG